MNSEEVLRLIREEWEKRSSAIDRLNIKKRQEREKMFQLLAAQEEVVLKVLDIVRECYPAEKMVLPVAGVRMVHPIPIPIHRSTLFFDPRDREFYLQTPPSRPDRFPEPSLFRGCKMRRQLLSEPFLLEELLRNTRYFERYLTDCVSGAESPAV